MSKKTIKGEDGKEYTVKEKKPFYKRWWFIALIVIIIFIAIGSGGDEENADVADDQEATEQVDEVAADETTEGSEEETAEETTNEITLGEPMEIGDYTLTIQSYNLGTDSEGKDALIINYDWVNNSEEATTPFMTFSLKGFQDGVETSDVFMVDGVDLGIGQKEVQSGGQIEGAQAVVGIDDMSIPLELELDELITFEENAYTTEIDLSTIE